MNDSAANSGQDSGQTPYRVLARKYRPSNFSDLIGQDALVRTLNNAFSTGRIAQAYILTGVRGVGKTTTARIIARALNYSRPGEVDAPTLDMAEMGEHCAAIMESRHVDVIEMDAASRTGINDIREIIESVRYRPVSARYKVYIIDEVHMLSTQAFNGLLKTLEEPPEHVKFIFATTEIRKVPVTVLSRCQRFDLRRVEGDVLVDFLKSIAQQESVELADEAAAVIARAAEGSVRDGLSILDQAIAHGNGVVGADNVRDMLGLADRARIIDLFGFVMAGDVAKALHEVNDQYDSGADPVVILSDLAAFVHFVTRVKFVPQAAADQALAEAERKAGADFAEKLDMRILARAWQVLLKGIAETQSAARPIAAAEMVIVRLTHMSDLPTPDELIRNFKGNSAGASAPQAAAKTGANAGAPRPENARATADSGPQTSEFSSPQQLSPAPFQVVPETDGVELTSFDDVVRLAGEKRDISFKVALEHHVRPVSFEPGKIEIDLTASAPKNIAHDLSRRLLEWTGKRWMVGISAGKGGHTVAEVSKSQRETMLQEAAEEPLVRAILEKFPGAEITDVRENEKSEIPEDGSHENENNRNQGVTGS